MKTLPQGDTGQTLRKPCQFALFVDGQIELWDNRPNKGDDGNEYVGVVVSEPGSSESQVNEADGKSSRSRNLKSDESRKAEIVLRYQNRMMMVIE